VTIDQLELSVRSYNCLKSASIETLDELLRQAEKCQKRFR
jgi:DNA-directed RNA polymerase alpha subunit